jgi:mannose-1-phosphate guanylyltransferase/phosphomannomutase
MRAVVMAGGEGTRLRPLTSNQPKPMVPIVGRPCLEHVVELLRRHGFEEVVITLAFLPQAIRSYFGNGSTLGLELEYSVEEVPLGTAGSVRLASGRLNETTLVISGDALCDIDLTQLIAVHRQKEAAVTIGLKSVENPLEFGIVVTDDDGRVERFLEKPSWGEVFSDTINTGIYVLEPEVLKHVPTEGPYDFSKELFPKLLELGEPIYGHVCDGYWQDIGNLDQFRAANFDALDEKVQLSIPGLRLNDNVWIGEGVEVDDVEAIEGPAFIGADSRIDAGAAVGPYAVLSSGVTLREGARVTRSIIDTGSYVGRSALVEGAVLGRNCELRQHVRLHEGVAIGDQVTIGEESVLYPGVRVYPYKEVETGSQIRESVIWESRASTRLFARDQVQGLVNVDLTPETAVRLGAALGSALKRGSNVVGTRESAPAFRMLKRAVMTGLNSAGVRVIDLRTLPAPVGKQLLNAQSYDAAFHIGASPNDPEGVQISFFERPGVAISGELQREVEKHFARGEFRRVPFDEVGSITYPPRAREGYMDALLATLDPDRVRKSTFRIVVDYGRSSASHVLPLVLAPLGVEVIASHAFESDSATQPDGHVDTIGRVRHLVKAISADFGAAFDRPGERVFLVDENGLEVPPDLALLLFLTLLRESGIRGKIAVPITATSKVDTIAGDALEVVRTRASLSSLTQAATEPGMVFAGADYGGYSFPSFLPAYDATASLCNLLQLLAGVDRPLSELVAELPRPTLVHRAVPCPWALKGTVMRVFNEWFAGQDIDVLDGIKIFEERGWMQVLPDPDEPVIHVYAEGETEELSLALEVEATNLVAGALQGEEIDALEGIPS